MEIDLEKIGQLKQEISNLEFKMEERLTRLGEMVFTHWEEHKDCRITDDIRAYLEKISALKEVLENKRRNLGELIVAYETKVIDTERMMELKEDLDRTDATIEQYIITADSPFCNQMVRHLGIPRDVLISAIMRQDEVLIPDGDTVIQEGDKLTIIGKKKAVIEVLKSIIPNP